MTFAICFICNESGHLSKDCPRNENGIYPYGGGCYFCGSKMHKKADCPDKGKYNNNKKKMLKDKNKAQEGNEENEVEDDPEENINVELEDEF